MTALPHSLFATPAQFLNADLGIFEQLHEQLFATFRPVAFGAFVDQLLFKGIDTQLHLSQHSGRGGCDSCYPFSRWAGGWCATLSRRQCRVNIFIHLACCSHFNDQRKDFYISLRKAARPALFRLCSWRKELTELLTPALNGLMAAIKKGLNIRGCVHALMLAHVRTCALIPTLATVRSVQGDCKFNLGDVLLSTMHYSADITKRTR